jgi:hypothetical protein
MSGQGQGKQGAQKANIDHHANQLSPNNPAYQQAQDNRANQMNPNNPAYPQAGNAGRR